MELLDLYDTNGNLLNKTIIRGDKNLADGEHIKLVTIWIKCKDRFLIPKCSVQKGGAYAVTGGHVQTGKTSQEQAKIELKEELGLEINLKDLMPLGNIFGEHSIFDVFMIENNILDIYNFTLQQEEVEDVFWLSKSEIEGLIQKSILRKSTEIQYEKFIKNIDSNM